MKNLIKLITTGAIAALLLPTLALANEGGGVRGEGANKPRFEHRLEKAEKREARDAKYPDRLGKRATTTAAAITKQGVRVQQASENLLSFSTRASALIANADAEDKTALEAKFAAYATAANNAKVEALKAITTAGQIQATNSTSTNAALLISAKADLKEAKGLLHDAKQAFFSILRTLW